MENNLILHSLRDENDRERYATFNAVCNNPFEGATCACLLHHHPDTTLDDYWMVEDSSTGEVVSTTCLLPWECCFEGVDLRVAQLEMVLTHPAYRGRGLVRAQIQNFEQVARSRGFDLSIIGGIPYYYRQYGYAYAIDMDRRESLPVWEIPDHSPGDNRPVRLRPANLSDLPGLVGRYPAAVSTLDFYTRRSLAYWQYLLEAAKYPIEVVENAQTREILGYGILQHTNGQVTILESGLSAVTDCLSLLQHLRNKASQQVLLGGSPYTPLAQLAHSLGSQVVESPQWLLRFLDVARFLVRIGPALENRLTHSSWRGLTADIIVNLYRQAYRLRFAEGRLAGVDALGFVDASMGADGGHLCIPPEAFVRLVTGYRALEALFDAWPDIVVKPGVRGLIDVLFPPVKSYLYMPYHFMGKVNSGVNG